MLRKAIVRRVKGIARRQGFAPERWAGRSVRPSRACLGEVHAAAVPRVSVPRRPGRPSLLDLNRGRLPIIRRQQTRGEDRSACPELGATTELAPASARPEASRPLRRSSQSRTPSLVHGMSPSAPGKASPGQAPSACRQTTRCREIAKAQSRQEYQLLAPPAVSTAPTATGTTVHRERSQDYCWTP